jgi:glucose-6-phosphate isomerase
MLTAGIKFLNFKEKKNSLIVKKKLKLILQKKDEVIKSLGKNYINSYKKNNIQKYKKLTNFRIIGMGGSTLGSQAIYDFLNHKIKKNFIFIDNLECQQKKEKRKKIYKYCCIEIWKYS